MYTASVFANSAGILRVADEARIGLVAFRVIRADGPGRDPAQLARPRPERSIAARRSVACGPVIPPIRADRDFRQPMQGVLDPEFGLRSTSGRLPGGPDGGSSTQDRRFLVADTGRTDSSVEAVEQVDEESSSLTASSVAQALGDLFRRDGVVERDGVPAVFPVRRGRLPETDRRRLRADRRREIFAKGSSDRSPGSRATLSFDPGVLDPTPAARGRRSVSTVAALIRPGATRLSGPHAMNGQPDAPFIQAELVSRRSCWWGAGS